MCSLMIINLRNGNYDKDIIDHKAEETKDPINPKVTDKINKTSND